MRFNAEREAQIRKECFGKGMINTYYLHELFEEIKLLESEKRQLTTLLFEREHRMRNLQESKSKT